MSSTNGLNLKIEKVQDQGSNKLMRTSWRIQLQVLQYLDYSTRAQTNNYD